MNSLDFAKLALQLATMLGCAVLCGALMRRLKQPAVVGEICGGIVLGPHGVRRAGASRARLAVRQREQRRRRARGSHQARHVFFLFHAGLEVNLSDLRGVGRRALLIGLTGTLLPIAAGVGLVYAVPRSFWGPAVQEHFLSFALFIGMNLANSANPVIARILIDLELLDRPIGALIMSATIVDDLVNWTLFAVILSDIAPSTPAAAGGIVNGILLVAALFAGILGLGRWLGPAALRRIRPHVPWPSGFIAVTAMFVLLASSAAEALGVHAFLGAFLTGVALGGDEQHAEAHAAIGYVVMSFAPIYFVSMGMAANFATSFDPVLAALILAAGCASKLGSVVLGAVASRMPVDRELWAVAFGLNARGATGIVLAGVGRANGVIDDRIFVAIVSMALATSVMAAPAMNRLLRTRRG